MKFTFADKKITASDDLHSYAEKKISKLDKFFRQESEAFVTFSIERGRHLAEVTIKNNGIFYRVSEATSNMYASVDSAVAAIERQIRKNKTRLEKKLRAGSLDTAAEPMGAVEIGDADEDEEEALFEIVRTKRFALKPMTPEEAILQMNLLGHEFFAFKNQDADNVFSVVYKRNNGGYGLIENDEE